MKLVFLGPPGSGKGTAAAKIARSRSLPHISTGDLFRSAVASESELGRSIRGILDAGGLVPDDLTIALVRDRLARDDVRQGFILDGFPRTLPQAKALALFAPPDAVLCFMLEDREIVKRLSGRRVCGSCGRIFHLVDLPPARAGACDACGGALVAREDDRAECIERRLAVYRAETEPLIAYYRGEGIVKEVSSTGSPEETLRRVEDRLSHVTPRS